MDILQRAPKSNSMSNMSTLSIVATPIGNLEDITLRAIRALKEADMVLCEDTRVTRKLLQHYDIDTPTMSYHSHSTLSKTDKITELLQEGKSLALVSDAGTPGISDPGTALVAHIRKELPDVTIEAIPGASALTAAISIAGVRTADFVFLGFLPHKKGRETLFTEMAESKRTIIFYESPHRFLKTIDSLIEHVPQGNIVIARELTKIHEQVVSGTPQEIKNYFLEHEEKVRGEFVVIVSK